MSVSDCHGLYSDLETARTALSTFSQLIFPLSVLCIGKLSKFLDFESYLSSAIGASSRKQGQRAGHDYYLRHYYGQNSSSATGPVHSQRTPKRTYGDSVEELPLRTYSNNGGRSKDDVELSDAIMVKRDVTVSSENGSRSPK